MQKLHLNVGSGGNANDDNDMQNSNIYYLKNLLGRWILSTKIIKSLMLMQFRIVMNFTIQMIIQLQFCIFLLVINL